MGLHSGEVEELISELITENFINEERFAISFAGGRFRLKKWGRIKIEHALRQRGLTDYCINKGMEEIEEADYLDLAANMIHEKWLKVEGNHLEKKEKVTRFMAQKGFEFEIINKILREYS